MAPTEQERDWELPCTRAEAEANTRQVVAICRGPWRMTLDGVRLSAGTTAAIRRAVPDSARLSADAVLSRLIAAGEPRAAYEVQQRAHVGCGYSVMELICRYPFDGKQRTAPCPKCGVMQDFISPRYACVDDIPEPSAP